MNENLLSVHVDILQVAVFNKIFQFFINYFYAQILSKLQTSKYLLNISVQK